MKNSVKINGKTGLSILFITVLAIFGACRDEEVKAVVKPSSAVDLAVAASASTLVLDSAKAASTVAETFTWNAADYGAQFAVAYTLQIDSASGTFAHPVEVNLDEALTLAYTKKALNDLALSLKLVPGVAGQIKARVKSDVNPNVEKVYSNVLTLTITPYSTKPTPKFPVPDSLYLVGDATAGAWANPVPAPSQKFTRIDDNTFGMVTNLIGGKGYLFLPKNGDWSHKYNVAGSSANPAGDTFAPDAGNNNIPGPAADGLYKIIVDFVKGTYALTLLTASPVPDNLFIVGDATAGQWANPVPIPSQQFKQISNAEFSIKINLTTGKSYLFLPKNGDWGHKYGGTSNAGGDLLYDGSVPNSNTPAPDAAGDYVINVNFLTLKYSVSK